jgi:hypothetical protein
MKTPDNKKPARRRVQDEDVNTSLRQVARWGGLCSGIALEAFLLHRHFGFEAALFQYSRK